MDELTHNVAKMHRKAIKTLMRLYPRMFAMTNKLKIDPSPPTVPSRTPKRVRIASGLYGHPKREDRSSDPRSPRNPATPTIPREAALFSFSEGRIGEL